MRNIIKILIVILLNVVFFISGCVNENIVPGSSNVTVHMYDGRGFPNDISDSRVSIGSYPERVPDGNGIVQFPMISLPYNLKFQIGASYGKYLCVFENISNKENFIVFINAWAKYFNEIVVYLYYPNIYTKKRAYVKFISKDIFSDRGAILLNSSHSPAAYHFYLSSNKRQIQGKFLFFEVTCDTFSHTIISFDRYGEKNVNLTAGPASTITFTDDDIKFNPDESFINYNIDMLNSGYGFDTQISLSFDGYFNSDFLLYDFGCISNNKKSYQLVVPSSLPSPFRIKLSNANYSDNGGGQAKWVYGSPGTTITLDNTIQPVLISPGDNSIITDTSSFVFDSVQKGIFKINFSNSQNFFTSKKKVTLGELKAACLSFLPGTSYSWYVEQYCDFSSLDEFLSTPYTLNPIFTSVISSYSRVFSTAH